MKKNKAVIVENLTFQYPDTDSPVLKDISFSLEYGEILGIVGPTGAGKSTLAMSLNALVPTVIEGEIKGSITVDGKDVSKQSVGDMAGSVGFVFQEPENQLSQMTIEEEVAFGLGNLGVERQEMVNRIKESLKAVGLQGYEKRSPLALSGGQQQRLALAAVLAMRPNLMILDEPTSMLDPQGKNEVFDVLKDIKSLGMTGIIIDHEVERLAAYCNKILVLHEGECKMFGTPKEIFSELESLHQLSVNGPQVSELSYKINKEFDDKDMEMPITLEEATKAFKRRTRIGEVY
ncbi:energy-coupling factor ABC transporter ATP-binding protein [Alkalihalobacillus sp. AL-G]|uniref:energy-coupling factor ABC transporter ATP-binding protein n=1 Tax=Alkalihalobacillus sp. AL-G TaxID=2926399 RepID=UPI002729F392|nr:ABC transporter ATP-binding protein [Alkalihalobacillus sp. AL-G]WLD93582.1 energy-coupling factor ABC transporter ATP-binding protein [Alkalihalobacillus sp. AL-G]